MNFKKQLTILISAISFASCSIQMRIDAAKDGEEEKNRVEVIVEDTKLNPYKGWWVYGEGQHIFKDEKTLDEYDLEFPNENMDKLKALYLAVCEMEYFPMECTITGHLKNSLLKKQTILIVSEFEILHIEGCGE